MGNRIWHAGIRKHFARRRAEFHCPCCNPAVWQSSFTRAAVCGPESWNWGEFGAAPKSKTTLFVTGMKFEMVAPWASMRGK
jgi:hypothetical protein